MKRREFITLLGGAAAAWPLAARAQQQAMPVIGFLDARSPDDYADRLRAFRQGLEGDRLCRGRERRDRIPLGGGSIRPAAGAGGRTGSPTGRRDRRLQAPSRRFAAKAATATIPIVFIVSRDPVRLGLVASLARPGGNVTGINFVSAELVAKRLELLRELVPGAARVAVLVNPADATNTETTLRDVEPAARAIGLQIQVLKADTSQEIDAAFAAFVRERPDALFVGSEPLLHRPACSTGSTDCVPQDPRDICWGANMPKSAG